MIVYQATKSKFLHDSDHDQIEDVVERAYVQRVGRYASRSEFKSWRASLVAMARVLRDEDIPNDIGVGVEFGIPQTAKRIDFILSGKTSDDTPRVVIVELKQWSKSRISEKDGILIANRGGGAETEGAHPSYQAWSYAALLNGFNEAVSATCSRDQADSTRVRPTSSTRWWWTKRTASTRRAACTATSARIRSWN